MIEAILIFAAQFGMIMLLGIQSLNVRDRDYVGSSITSLLLGVFGFHVTSTIAAMSHEGVGSLVWWFYIAAGPCGIATSIWLHPRLKKLFGNT